MIKQRIGGAILIILSALSLLLGEGTPALAFIPLGIYMLVTKNNINEGRRE